MRKTMVVGLAVIGLVAGVAAASAGATETKTEPGAASTAARSVTPAPEPAAEASNLNLSKSNVDREPGAASPSPKPTQATNLNSSKSNSSRNQAKAANEIPLEGIEVSLSTSPGKGNIASVTTNAKGEFDLGVQDKGSYDLTINPPPDQVAGSAPEPAADKPVNKTESPQMPAFRRLNVFFEGVEDGPITAHLRFSTKEIEAEMKKDKPGILGISLPLDTNGQSAIKGIVTEAVSAAQ